MKIEPKCHPYWYDNNGNKIMNVPKLLEYSGEGWVYPCCWSYNTAGHEELKQLGMMDEELRLENVSSVKEILLSKQWVMFNKMLLDDSVEKPAFCKKYCASRK